LKIQTAKSRIVLSGFITKINMKCKFRFLHPMRGRSYRRVNTSQLRYRFCFQSKLWGSYPWFTAAHFIFGAKSQI